MAKIVDIAEAVKAELNGGEFSQSFTAERHYQPVFELKDMKALHVTVVPKDTELQLATRNSSQHDCRMDEQAATERYSLFARREQSPPGEAWPKTGLQVL